MTGIRGGAYIVGAYLYRGWVRHPGRGWGAAVAVEGVVTAATPVDVVAAGAVQVVVAGASVEGVLARVAVTSVRVRGQDRAPGQERSDQHQNSLSPWVGESPH
ncbi:hypothetical protein GCM10009555_067220 [Acrocarpospora macrocephala]|uniref:Uncharacterized protein n=1 Tax=Acrocarpospora macrocephala TaxID=150177 RepID=A0A5M3WJ68_9ACTN|nr:hypothetical protein Amac_028130 [Acrocarpospora macrocephala]